VRIRFTRDDDDFTGIEQPPRQTRGKVGNDQISVHVEIQKAAGIGIMQEVVRLVEQNPVREPGSATQYVQRRED
jgi:hypothetical protein